MNTPDHVVVELIRAGLTTREIREQTRADYSRIARLRKQHKLPVPTYRPPSQSITEALALYTEHHGDGHLRWTGPNRGRTPVFESEGTRYNARAVLFRRHWGRDPVGYIRTTCPISGCITGAHLADQLARTTGLTTTAAIEHLIQEGAGNWEIVRRLGTSNHTIARIRRDLNSKAGHP
jgi:DNA-binding CsgD family transcriptional regulator